LIIPKDYPNNVVSNSLTRLTAKQLKTLGDTATMGNHKYTIKSMAKVLFEADDVAVNRVAMAMGNITKAQLSVCDLAFSTQYHDKMKTAFRDEVIEKYGEAMKAEGALMGAQHERAQHEAGPR
jgi:hypothetical protein